MTTIPDHLPWAISEEIDAQKYRLQGETFKDKVTRIAGTLADNPQVFHAFREMLGEQRFLPGGRIQAAVGSSRHVTAMNCFVSGTIADSFVEGPGSIMVRATEAAQTLRMGGGIGFDFSTIRPRGDRIAKLDSQASGPISFAEIFNAICHTVSAAGHRRGAMMGVLRVDHPDIELFVHAKNDSTSLTGFNLSVAVTNAFMNAVEMDERFPLRFEGRVYREIQARALWEQILRNTWSHGEPGVLFIDRINEENNLWYAETIAASNPCAEQCLPPFGACLLGSLNLTRYTRPGVFDFDRLGRDVRCAVRCLDRVIDLTIYPLPEQKAEALAKRRMGIGVTGLANAGAILGEYRYGSEEFCQFARDVMATITHNAYRASVALAEERGAFPLFERDKYLAGRFISRLPEDIRDGIASHGIRNSHLISIAPTGTISLTAGNVSSGIEPVWRLGFERIVRDFDGHKSVLVRDYAYDAYGVENGLATELTPREHLSVMEAIQPLVDSSISKTVNVSSELPWEDFKSVYTDAFSMGLKSVATFTFGGKREGILKAKECRGDSCEL